MLHKKSSTQMVDYVDFHQLWPTEFLMVSLPSRSRENRQGAATGMPGSSGTKPGGRFDHQTCGWYNDGDVNDLTVELLWLLVLHFLCPYKSPLFFFAKTDGNHLKQHFSLQAFRGPTFHGIDPGHGQFFLEALHLSQGSQIMEQVLLDALY